jgi:hypothetical protein
LEVLYLLMARPGPSKRCWARPVKGLSGMSNLRRACQAPDPTMAATNYYRTNVCPLTSPTCLLQNFRKAILVDITARLLHSGPCIAVTTADNLCGDTGDAPREACIALHLQHMGRSLPDERP